MDLKGIPLLPMPIQDANKMYRIVGIKGIKFQNTQQTINIFLQYWIHSAQRRFYLRQIPNIESFVLRREHSCR